MFQLYSETSGLWEDISLYSETSGLWQDMSLYSETSGFQANPYLLLFLNTVCSGEKEQVSIL
jgi:hypothetical protein